MRISDWSSDVCSSDLAAIDFGDVADDGKAEAGAGLVAVEADAAVEDAVAVCGGDADAVVLDLDLGGRPVARDGDEHAAAAIFGRVFEQVSDQFVEVLPLDARDERLVTCRTETHRSVDHTSTLQSLIRN